MVFDSGGRGDKSFNDSAYAGLERAKKEYGIEFATVDSKADKDYETNLETLAERGYDPLYGARPLRRLMQHEIDDRLARALLTGAVRDGDTVVVGLADDGEALTVARADAPTDAAATGASGAEGLDDDVIDAEIIDDER